jgi:hypothetical protein
MDYFPTRTVDQLRECETNLKKVRSGLPLSPVETNVIDTLLIKVDDSITDKHLSGPTPISHAPSAQNKGGGFIA